MSRKFSICSLVCDTDHRKKQDPPIRAVMKTQQIEWFCQHFDSLVFLCKWMSRAFVPFCWRLRKKNMWPEFTFMEITCVAFLASLASRVPISSAIDSRTRRFELDECLLSWCWLDESLREKRPALIDTSRSPFGRQRDDTKRSTVNTQHYHRKLDYTPFHVSNCPPHIFLLCVDHFLCPLNFSAAKRSSLFSRLFS